MITVSCFYNMKYFIQQSSLEPVCYTSVLVTKLAMMSSVFMKKTLHEVPVFSRPESLQSKIVSILVCFLFLFYCVPCGCVSGAFCLTLTTCRYFYMYLLQLYLLFVQIKSQIYMNDLSILSGTHLCSRIVLLFIFLIPPYNLHRSHPLHGAISTHNVPLR